MLERAVPFPAVDSGEVGQLPKINQRTPFREQCITEYRAKGYGEALAEAKEEYADAIARAEKATTEAADLLTVICALGQLLDEDVAEYQDLRYGRKRKNKTPAQATAKSPVKGRRKAGGSAS